MVPILTVARNMAVQTLVMINPTGKMPNFRPGITKPESPLPDPGLVEAASWVVNTPLMKDVPFVERFAIRGIPSALVPENAIVGARYERAESLHRS